MKIEIKFEWESEFYPFETDKKDWYVKRKWMAYVIKGLSHKPHPSYSVETTLGDFIENPTAHIGEYMIYVMWPSYSYSPKIEDVRMTNDTPPFLDVPKYPFKAPARKMWKLTEQILFILDKIPDTRNDDVLLTLEIWKEFYSEKLLDFESWQAVMLSELFQLPREDHIKRIRAKIQNDEKKFLPTSWEVAKKRQINQWVWELAMQETTKEIVNP